jgi:hypothetical protein
VSTITLLISKVMKIEPGKVEFRKRVIEAGKNNKSGYTYAMQSPTREQMHCIFKNMLPPEEIDFRLDVVGCNPRYLGMEFETYKLIPEFKMLVEETCEEVLGCSKTTDVNTSHSDWVMGVVMQCIDTAIVGDNKVTMNSLFREDIVENKELISVFCSTFMCFLAGKIRDKFATDSLSFLTMIFGRSGVGNCHEYDSHNFFCGLTSPTHPCWNMLTKRWVDVQLGEGPRQKGVFRNIKDISHALASSSTISSRYLLPSITNLALIDSIIPPKVVLQMTISDTHRGASTKAVDIVQALKVPQILMIFVVPETVVTKFKFPNDLPNNIDLYVTVAKTMTLADAQKIKMK